MRRAVVCVMWLGALAVPACGGSSSGSGSGSASCSGDTKCGGNLVGTWKIDAACASATASTGAGDAGTFCPTATLDTSALTVTGTFTYGADLTYSSSLVEGGSVHYTIPNSCLTSNGQTVTCDQLGTALGSGDATFSSISCKTSGSNCLCDFGTKATTVNETGTYTVAGSALTMTASTGDVSTGSFCATGTQLHLAEMDMGMTVGTIVATKQ